MTSPNLERMLQLVDDFFAMKNDPQQLNVTEAVIARLRAMHPRTLTERTDDNGPIAWILLIPTTRSLMKRFITGEITEQQLYDLTPDNGPYEALYLCSALVLPEFRGEGIARQLTCDAIRAIRNDHPITDLFYWTFSREGDRLASSVARELCLPIHKRRSDDHRA